jgi:putative colanic acid biosynthesis acetyltransferase WcaF
MVINYNTFEGPSFSLGNRLARVCWWFINILLFRLSPVPFHGWRSFLLRLFGAKIGKNVHIYPGVRIWAPWNLVCGDGVGIGGGAIIYNQGVITLGCRAVVSQGVHLCAGTHDYNHSGHPLITKPIIIGDRVWIAAEAFVHPGITINEGAVIGARSVVTKDMPAWTVCAGHPCKPIKARALLRD